MHIGLPLTTLHRPLTPQNTKSHGLPTGQNNEGRMEGIENIN